MYTAHAVIAGGVRARSPAKIPTRNAKISGIVHPFYFNEQELNIF
jgi:hypothetical protein